MDKISPLFSKLQNKELFCNRSFIAGQWLETSKNKPINVLNPATSEIICEVSAANINDTKKAIDLAQTAQQHWRNVPAIQKASIIKKMADLLLENQQDLAWILTLEQGKPLAEAAGEIAYAASFLEWFAAEARRIYGDSIPANSNDRRILVLKEPVGVVAAITPWNFPSAMIARKLAAALAAGCAMIVKPAQQTPLSALVYGKIAKWAGLPDGLLSILIGNAKEIGGELTSNPKVRKITFTGSTSTGKLLMSQAAETMKRVSFELGGNAPFIVFADADIEQAVNGAIISKYRNGGQTCVCSNRIYIQNTIYDKFCAAYVEKTKELKVGNGLESDTSVGPLIDQNAVKKIEEHINDAVSKGGIILAGGKKHPLGGSFFEPTVISQANKKMLVAKEETFGPLAPLFSFNSEADVINLANDTEYGLAAYFYSRDIGRIWRVAEKLEYGMVGVNTGLISTAEAPFGGVKQSGMGREGSKYGLDDYLSTKYLCLAGLDQ